MPKMYTAMDCKAGSRAAQGRGRRKAGSLLKDGDKFNRIEIAHYMGAGINVLKYKVIYAYLYESSRSVGVLIAANNKFRPHVFPNILL
jgi:hypothetical protein